MKTPHTILILTALLTGLLIGLYLGRFQLAHHIARDRIVSGEESVLINDGPIRYEGRVDSGATVTSIHAEDIEVIGGSSASKKDDTGKTLRFALVNDQDERVVLERTIERVHFVHSSDCGEWRYYVRLTLEFRGRKKELLVNLNDRSRSSTRLLLGRDWLKQGYVVDISQPTG